MYTVKLIKPNGEESLYSAHHVVLNRKQGQIEICNPGKPSSVVNVPADAGVVYVISDDSRKTVATLRPPDTLTASEGSEPKPEIEMEMHNTRGGEIPHA